MRSPRDGRRLPVRSPRDGPRWRQRASTVRVRTTAAAVAVVGLALVVAAIGMVLMLRRSLTADVHLAARLRASDLADLLASGTPAHRLVVGRLDEAFVQVVDGGGKVIASSRNLEASSPVAELPLSEPVQLADPTVDDEPFLVVAAIAEAPGGRVTVLVGQTLETVAESTQVVTSLLGLGLPLSCSSLGPRPGGSLAVRWPRWRPFAPRSMPSPPPSSTGACRIRPARTRSRAWPQP